jgi:hypothetical protein
LVIQTFQVEDFLMLSLLLSSPELLNALFMLGGAALGWWIKRRQGTTGIPGDVADLLLKLVEARRHAQSQQALATLLQHAPPSALPAAPPPASGAVPSPAISPAVAPPAGFP